VLAALQLEAVAGSSGTGCAAGLKGAMYELGVLLSASGLGCLPGISSILVRTFNARIEFMVTSRMLRRVKLQSI
jgi:hypothetical protein